MFPVKAGLTCVAAIALEVAGFCQTPPAPPVPPAAPSAPRAPRALRGYSVTTPNVNSRRGYLGVGVAEITEERAKALKLPSDSGVEVKHVDESSPASKAGLKETDVILEVNGQKVDDVEQFVRTIGDAGPTSKVDLAVWRAGTKQNITATLGSRRGMVMAVPGNGWDGALMAPRALEEAFPALVGDAPKVGFEGEMLTPQLAEFFGVKEGVLVRTVNSKSPAEKAGLKAGDVVIKVNGTPVTSPREISSLLRASRKSASFTVMRNHKEVTLNVEVAEDRSPGPDRLVL
jgi:serine protease Do